MPQIAELYAKITGDSTQLKGELNKTKTVLGEVGKGFEQVAGISLSSFATIAGGVGMVINYLKDAFQYTAQYATQVQDLSRVIGANSEESSRLIQVADDVRISYETLAVAMKGALMKGFEPTIEGLKAMSDQYLAIQDPIARSTFLLDTFGRSGLEMGRLMELGAAGIDKLGESAKNILTEEDIAKMEAARVAFDELDDSSNELKSTIAIGLAPALSATLGFISKAVDVGFALSKQYAQLVGIIWDLVKAFFALNGAQGGGTITNPITGAKTTIVANTGNAGNWNRVANQRDATGGYFKGYAGGGILVGERGPEVLNPRVEGHITPNESASIRIDDGSIEKLAKAISDKMAMARA